MGFPHMLVPNCKPNYVPSHLTHSATTDNGVGNPHNLPKANPMKFVVLILNGFRFAPRFVLVLLFLASAHGRSLEDKIVFFSKRNG